LKKWAKLRNREKQRSAKGDKDCKSEGGRERERESEWFASFINQLIIERKTEQ